MRLAASVTNPERPWPGRRLIPWWLRGDAEFFRDLGGALQSAAAMSVAEARGSDVVVAAIEHRAEVVLEPEADINVLALPARHRGCAASAIARRRVYEPEGRARTARFFETYAVDTMEAERELGASAFVPPHHLVGGAGSRGRRRDLLLQQLAYEHFQLEIEPQPSLVAGVPRRFAVAATFDLLTLSDIAERTRLIRLYADLPGDFLWIRIAQLNDAAPVGHIAAAAEFLLRLRAAAGRDLVAVGLGTLSYPFMASGLSAALGFGASEYYRGPRTRRDQPERSFRFATFHRNGLRNVVPTGPGDLAHVLFDVAPCDCPHHPGHVPPANGWPRRYHSASCRIQDAYELTSPDIFDSEEEMLRRLELAEALSNAHSPRRPFPADSYRTVVAVARRLRAEPLEAAS
jgi:hypothetical protein